MTWADVAVASAFVVGIIVGGIGVIRIYKYSMDYLKGQEPKGENGKTGGDDYEVD